MFSWKRWTSTKFVPNKRQMWLSCSEYRSYLYVVWSKIPWFSTCYLEPTVRKDTWTSFVTTMLFFFFENCILKVIWSQLCSKFLLSNYEARWKQHIEIYPYSWIFYFIKTSVHIMKQKLMKVPGKRLVAQKSERALRRTLHLNRLCFSASTLFYKDQWNFDEDKCSFSKVFCFKTLLLCSYFSRKTYLLTTKITLDVYNCL